MITSNSGVRACVRFWQYIGSLTAMAILVGACTPASEPPGMEQTDGSDAVSTLAARSADVDPQVFSDVVAGAFPMPGQRQRRTIRVKYHARSLANVACGGESFPDQSATSMRFDQARYADLDLIDEKGLAESQAALEYANTKVEVGDCVETVLPSYHDWSQLAAPWRDITRTAALSDAVTATESDTAECLQMQANVDAMTNLDPSDPTASFLSSVVGYHMTSLPDSMSDEARTAEKRKLVDAFVECTPEYFEAMAAELAPERERMVERNRELLERFAGELVSAGYVP